MPEGDTIFHLAARLREAFAGQRITRFQATEPKLQRDDVEGRVFDDAEAQGKNLLIRLSGGLTLHSHLQMRGLWFIERPAQQGSLQRVGRRVHGEWRPAQVRLATERASCLGINLRVLRWLQRPQQEPKHRLGPDLLAADFDPDRALARWLEHPTLELGVLLLRQDLVAGIGNVFKSETLFLEGLHPRVRVADVPRARLAALLDRNWRLVRRNAVPGGRRTRFAAGGGPRLWVYERAGQRCLKCGEVIACLRQGVQLRSSYYCSVCQQYGSPETCASP